jgi:hypothetical protein
MEEQVFDGKAPESFRSPPSELERVRLIADLSRLAHEECLPEAIRSASLTLVGWLARRQPGETAHRLGCEEVEADAEPLSSSRVQSRRPV